MNRSTPAIRPYQVKDLLAIYEVCLRTGDAGQDATLLYTDAMVLGHRYVGPYAAFQPDLAFVLEDDQGVCGYVLGALHTQPFYETLTREWFPILQTLYPPPKGTPDTWTPTQRMHHEFHQPRLAIPRPASAFPSHLHVDLLPRAQGQGHGTRMIEALLDKLTRLGSPAVHLCLSGHNQRAERFYRQLGFIELARERVHPHEEDVYMGKRLA
jgi:ribosomal protein S18 acetylase RimI-like enzyme